MQQTPSIPLLALLALLGTAMIVASVSLRLWLIQTTDFHARVPTVRNDVRSEAATFLANLLEPIGLLMVGLLAAEFVLVNLATALEIHLGQLPKPLAVIIAAIGFYPVGWVGLQKLYLVLEAKRRRELGVSDWLPTGEVILYVSTEENTVRDHGPMPPDKVEEHLGQFQTSFLKLCEEHGEEDIYAIFGLAYDPRHFLELSQATGEEGLTVYLCLDENPDGSLIKRASKVKALKQTEVPLDSATKRARLFMELSHEEFAKQFEDDGARKP